MAELGDTIVCDTNSFAPANGIYGYSSVDDPRILGGGANAVKGISQETEFGPTILYPASSLDSLSVASKHLYKFRGYNLSTMTFDTWVTDNPASSPPAGGTYTNITIVDNWVS